MMISFTAAILAIAGVGSAEAASLRKERRKLQGGGKPTYYPTYSPVEIVNPDPTKSALFDRGDELPEGSYDKCEGDCDTDDDCVGNLLCYYRDGYESVPGCTGSGTPGWDYCWRPDNALYVLGDELPEGSYGMCDGDCDSDADCEGDLVCELRDGTEVVPGCTGEQNVPSNWDFCELFTK